MSSQKLATPSTPMKCIWWQREREKKTHSHQIMTCKEHLLHYTFWCINNFAATKRSDKEIVLSWVKTQVK